MKPTIALVTVHGLSSKPIDFVSLELDQCYYDHHRVKIVLDMRNMGENVLETPMDKTSLVHTRIQIDIQEGDDKGGAYGWMGIVTGVEIDLDAGDHGWLYVYGASPTIDLDRGKIIQAFSGYPLNGIFEQISGGSMYLKKANNPKYTASLPFSMQYKETDWQYLRRLAFLYGENLWFSGDSIVFGQHDEKPTVKVTYDIELTEVKIGTRLIANTFQQYYHDTNFVKNSYEHKMNEGGTFAGGASKMSDELNLMRKPDTPVNASVEDMGGLQHITEARKKRTFTDMYHVTGKTKLYKMRIGSKLEIDFHKKMNVSDSLGTLRITKVRHIFDQTGHYWNEFEAVSAKHEVVPCPEIEIPVAQPMSALVINNEHPEGHGKVQLKFDFQDTTCDFWFPIVMPQASGHSDIGQDKNTGFIFLPEKNERIILNFFEGNPEFPFVHGSMYHGANAENQGGGAGNYIKTIITKSGHTIKLDDTKGKEKIQVFDKNGNLIQIDTPANTIDVFANDTINLNATNINLLAKNTITATAGNMFAASAGTTVSIVATISSFITAGKEAIIKAGKNLTAKAGKQTIVSSGTNALLELDSKGNTTLKGKKKVEVNSKQRVKIAGEKQTLMQSKDMKIQGKKKTSIKGNKVHVG